MSLSFHFSLDQAASTEDLKQYLITKLSAKQKVAWLVPGGSNISLSVAVMNSISMELRDNLTIMQTDERYGKYDHKDSNWLQLRQAGFDPAGAKAITVLTPENLSLEDTTSRYNEITANMLSETELVIGQFGVGPDGHIAGILPGTVGTDSNDYVVGYESGTLTRITLTVKALERINIAFAYVFGQSKHEALSRLANETLTVSEQPSQVLKLLPEAHIYQDQIKI